jgi:hypothetical protein
MSPFRTILTGAVFAVGVVLVVGGPATAYEGGSRHAAIAPTAISVTGELWSAPAYPVTCSQSEAQITCTPDDPAQIKPQQCFLSVFVEGARATLCTTYEEHIPAVKAAGGKALLVEYGCSLGDLVCVGFENAGRGLALAATAVMFLVSEAMRFDTTTLLWTAAVDEWSFWQWAILGVLFGAMVWAIAAAIVSGDRNELVGALVRSFIAIPAVPITLWLTGHLLNGIDDMTWYIMNRDGPLAFFSTLQSVMWAGGRANYFVAVVIHGLLMLGMVLLMLVFAFRNIVLAALIMVGPVAWMLFPLRSVGPQWVVRYLSAVAVLLLTGPLTIGFVTLIINGLAGVETIWDPQSWPLVVGLVMVAFAPFAIFGLFSFAGAVAADHVGSSLGSHGGRLAGRAAGAVARIPSRVGGLPSGVPAAGRSVPTPQVGRAGTTNRPGAAGPRGAGRPAERGGPAPAPARSSAPTTTSRPSTPGPQPPADSAPSPRPPTGKPS